MANAIEKAAPLAAPERMSVKTAVTRLSRSS